MALSSFFLDSTNVSPNECISVLYIRAGMLTFKQLQRRTKLECTSDFILNAGKYMHFSFFLFYLDITCVLNNLISFISVVPILVATGRA